MAYFNEFRLIGNLGGEPEIKDVNGKLFAKLSIAVQKPGKQNESKIDWFDITVFAKTAEYARDYLRKGDLILASGNLQKTTWIDPITQKNRYQVELVANDVQGLNLRSMSYSNKAMGG
ncbi:MAG: single-stranded DNA-binding protein [Pseudomonadota bacterium]